MKIEGDLEDELVKTNQRKSEKYFGNLKPVKNNFEQGFKSILCKLLYQSVCAAIVRYRRLQGVNNRHSFSYSSGS